MLRTILFCLLCLPVIVLGDEMDSPSILVHRNIIDLQCVKPNSTTPARFTFSNVGKKTLVIEKVETSCGCTIVALSRNSVEKGEEADLEVTFNAGGKQELVSHNITLHTNDPKRQETLLVLKATVEADVAWDPQYVELDWPVPENYTGQIKLSFKGIKPGVTSTSSMMNTLTVRQEQVEGNTVTVDFTARPGAAYVASDTILVDTVSADIPQARISVFYRQKPLLNYAEGAVVFDIFQNTAAEPQILTMSRTDGKPLHITAVEPSQKYFLTRILTNDALECRVEVKLQPGLLEGPCDGYMKIVTDVVTFNYNIPCLIHPPQQ